MLSVIAWSETYKAAAETKARLGLQVDNQYPETPANREICQQQQNANMAKIGAGIDAIEEALRLRPDYEDAMAYLNLLYRRKADLECANASARAADVRIADEWSDKAMAARKTKVRNMEQQPSAQ
jgi:hypothetical protein